MTALVTTQVDKECRISVHFIAHLKRDCNPWSVTLFNTSVSWSVNEVPVSVKPVATSGRHGNASMNFAIQKQEFNVYTEGDNIKSELPLISGEANCTRIQIHFTLH